MQIMPKNILKLLCYKKKHMHIFICRRLVCRLVGWSVGWSVGRSVGPLFTFSAFLSFLSLRLLPRCPSDLLPHCACPPWGSRLSRPRSCFLLVFFPIASFFVNAVFFFSTSVNFCQVLWFLTFCFLSSLLSLNFCFVPDFFRFILPPFFSFPSFSFPHFRF